MKEKIEFKKIREFGEIIGDTFLFIKQNFKPLMAALLSLSGIFILGGMISAIIVQMQIVENAGSYSGGGPFAKIYSMGFSYVLTILFMILIYTSMYVSILSFVILYIEKGKIAPNVTEVWAYFKYYFFRILGSILGLTLMIGVVLFIFIGGIAMINGALAVVCILIFILPAFIYIFPIMTLFYPVMIMENGSMWYSLGRSFKLLKSEWWITAAIILVIYIIFYACSLIVHIPAFIIMIIGAITHAENPISKTYAFVSAIAQHISFVFMIIPIVCSTLIYFNLVERKESLGLLNRIDGLGQNSNQAETPEEY